MSISDRARVVVPIIVLLSFSLAGCYTLLKHPKTGEMPEEADFSRCTDCHPSYSYPGPYDPPYPDPWYPPPWWHGPAVVVKDGNHYRTIYVRPGIEPDSGRISNPLGIIPPPGGGVNPPSTPTAVGAGKTTERDVKGSEQQDGSRPIHTREPEKKGNDTTQQSGGKDKK